jgi:hypothetical protein
MRRCVNRGCGVILRDTDAQCPVCGSETVDAGAPKKEKQPHNEPMVAIRRKRGSCLTVIISIAIAAAVLYVLYTRILATDFEQSGRSTIGRKLFDILGREPAKKK